MSDLNVSTMVGRVVKDAELKQTEGGTYISNFCIASNRAKKVNDEWKDHPHFFWFKLFGDHAKNMNKYLVKGQAVSILGHLEQDRWESNGIKHSKTSFVLDEVHLIGSVKNQTQSAEGNTDENQYSTLQEPDDNTDPDFDMNFNPEDFDEENQ